VLTAPRRAACIVLLAACSATPPPSTAPATPPAPVLAPEPATPPPANPTTPEPAPATPEPPPTEPPEPPLPPFCAQVDLGLDLRALPTSTDPDGVDMFVIGEAQDLRDVTFGEPPPRIFNTPGAGILLAKFDATTARSALTRCKQAVAEYMKTAPRLPILMTPAARVTTPCRPCK